MTPNCFSHSTQPTSIHACTVAKLCLKTDHQALLVNCSAPSATDSRKTRRVVTFPDIRQHNLAKLSDILQQQDWTDITTESDIDIS